MLKHLFHGKSYGKGMGTAALVAGLFFALFVFLTTWFAGWYHAISLVLGTTFIPLGLVFIFIPGVEMVYDQHQDDRAQTIQWWKGSENWQRILWVVIGSVGMISGFVLDEWLGI